MRSYHLEQEHSIRSQESVHESANLVRLDIQMLRDKVLPTSIGHQGYKPEDEIQSCHDGQDGQPEPQKNEYFLGEHVDDEHALHRVSMHIPQNSDLEIAQRDSGELARVSPLSSHEQVVKDMCPEHRVVRCLQKRVEQHELEHHVAQMQRLDEDVHWRNVRPVEFSELHDSEYVDTVATGTVLPLVHEGVVDVAGDHVDSFITDNRVDVLLSANQLEDESSI